MIASIFLGMMIEFAAIFIKPHRSLQWSNTFETPKSNCLKTVQYVHFLKMICPQTIQIPEGSFSSFSWFLIFAGDKYNLFSVSDADQEISTSGKRIMPESRFTSFPALSVVPRVGISRSASETDGKLFFSYLLLKKIVDFIITFLLLSLIFTINVAWWPAPNVIRTFSLWRVSDVCKKLTSLLANLAHGQDRIFLSMRQCLLYF